MCLLSRLKNFLTHWQNFFLNAAKHIHGYTDISLMNIHNLLLYFKNNLIKVARKIKTDTSFTLSYKIAFKCFVKVFELIDLLDILS